tara:strand:- start:374 stop:502 length:129 start_codon:yes stop_codon:yes gene_type:complete
MSDPVWSVIVMVILAMFLASFSIWWILWEAHRENLSESEKDE